MKALTRPLSSYTLDELARLPTNVRKTYRIVVQPDISVEQLKAAMIQLVTEETARDPDIETRERSIHVWKAGMVPKWRLGRRQSCNRTRQR